MGFLWYLSGEDVYELIHDSEDAWVVIEAFRFIPARKIDFFIFLSIWKILPKFILHRARYSVQYKKQQNVQQRQRHNIFKNLKEQQKQLKFTYSYIMH